MAHGLERALDVVHVDDVNRDAARRPSTNDDWDSAVGEERGKRVGAMQRDEHRAVDVSGDEVVAELLLVVCRLWREKDEDLVRLAEDGVDAADQLGEERVAEELGRGLWYDEADRLGAPRYEAARCPVRDIAELPDRLLDRAPGIRRDAVASVHDARHRRAGDACSEGNGLERLRVAPPGIGGTRCGPIP